MKCDRCKAEIAENEERDWHGQVVCEDCYMDCLSPAKTCDPWAVFAAKSFTDAMGDAPKLTKTQSNILKLLKETGGVPPDVLSRELQIKPSDLDREIATLRHMEKIRGELRNGKKVIRLW